MKNPLAIIWLIPISFIGLFLIFGLTDFVFDKGGFAAFVMLSVITVNAGIYLLSAWLQTDGYRSPVKRYVKVFNKKIQPISLLFSTFRFSVAGNDNIFVDIFATITHHRVGGVYSKPMVRN